MIQDIYPHRFDNTYYNEPAEDLDRLIICKGQNVLCKSTDTEAELPTVSEAEELWCIDRKSLYYLFKIDEVSYYLYIRHEELDEGFGYVYEHILIIRGKQPMYTAFAAAIGTHLSHWHTANRFCGRCGHKLMRSEKIRAMQCPDCGNTVFPRINPIIIAAVTDGDKLLVAKYSKAHLNTRNNHYVLIAGYVEIGESYEDTLKREVREETGLEVHNIRYVGSQPWPFSETSIAGFYAEADSSLPLSREAGELAELKWVDRSELPARPNRTSITDNLIEWFRHGMSYEEIHAELEDNYKLK